MKLKDGTEVVVIITSHTDRQPENPGTAPLDVVEVGSIYHEPRIEPCTLPSPECPHDSHVWDDPACAATSDFGTLVRRSIAHHVSEPCPKPECFGPVPEKTWICRNSRAMLAGPCNPATGGKPGTLHASCGWGST